MHLTSLTHSDDNIEVYVVFSRCQSELQVLFSSEYCSQVPSIEHNNEFLSIHANCLGFYSIFTWIYILKIESSSVFGSVIVGAFQITFRVKIHDNNVFSFFKNYFWHQHIKTIQNVQIILNFSKKKKNSNFLEIQYPNYSKNLKIFM
jgi:hypothetical protein